MLSDIEIAQQAKLRPIAEIAAGLGITNPGMARDTSHISERCQGAAGIAHGCVDGFAHR